MKKKDKFFEMNKSGFGTTTINYSGYGYGKHFAGMINIYGYDPYGFVFDYIVTYRRSKVITRMLKDGTWWNVDENIRGNYSTNGYTTRKGLGKANAERCKVIAYSHMVIDETGKSAHDARVAIRNNKLTYSIS